MQFLQIGSMWVNTHYITSIYQYNETVEIHFSENEADGMAILRDPAEIDAFLNWLTEKAPTYVVI